MPHPENEGRPVEAADGLPLLLTVAEVAGLLRLNRKTIYAMIARGELPGVRRFGRAIRLHRPTVIRWQINGQGRVSRSRRKR